MTAEEKAILIDCVNALNSQNGDYYNGGFLDGLILGLNLRSGSQAKVHVANGITLYDGDMEVYRWEATE